MDANDGYTRGEFFHYVAAVADCDLFWVEEKLAGVPASPHTWMWTPRPYYAGHLATVVGNVVVFERIPGRAAVRGRPVSSCKSFPKTDLHLLRLPATKPVSAAGVSV